MGSAKGGDMARQRAAEAEKEAEKLREEAAQVEERERQKSERRAGQAGFNFFVRMQPEGATAASLKQKTGSA